MTGNSPTNDILSRSFENCIVMEVIGSPSARQLIKAMNEIYQGKIPMLIIWDFTRGSAIKLSSADLTGLATHAKTYGDKRTGGRSAIIAPRDLEYGMGRMLEVYVEINKLPNQYKVFRDMESAAEWIGIDIAMLR